MHSKHLDDQDRCAAANWVDDFLMPHIMMINVTTWFPNKSIHTEIEPRRAYFNPERTWVVSDFVLIKIVFKSEFYWTEDPRNPRNPVTEHLRQHLERKKLYHDFRWTYLIAQEKLEVHISTVGASLMILSKNGGGESDRPGHDVGSGGGGVEKFLKNVFFKFLILNFFQKFLPSTPPPPPPTRRHDRWSAEFLYFLKVSSIKLLLSKYELPAPPERWDTSNGRYGTKLLFFRSKCCLRRPNFVDFCGPGPVSGVISNGFLSKLW